jgi:TANFOR domain-containing protein
MYTHSKVNITFFRFCLTALLITVSVTMYAQVINVYPTVLPPYSNRLTDYTQKPGKLNVTIQAGALRISPAYFYVEGKITSVDGNIQIYTQPGAKPKGGGIMLTQNTIHQLTFGELSAIFDDQTLVYKGITRAQVLKEGMPEGSYQICFKVFDYTTNQLFSADEPLGCSNMFSISAVEAPIIIQPQNDVEIQAMTPQNILFQWAQPAGTVPGLNYTLKILEMDNPKRNPEDAFKSTGYPVFFQTEVVNTMYLYTLANPPLIVGKKYAFRVTAHEGSIATRGVGTTFFRNGGNSEVYTFTYTANGAAPQNPQITASSASNFILALPYLSGTDHLKGSMTDADIKNIQDQIVADQNKMDTLNVTAENPVQFSWLWSSGDPKNPVIATKDNTYELSFFKYISNAAVKSSYTKQVTPFYTVTVIDTLRDKIFTLKDLQKAGFSFDNPFTFTLKAFNSAHKEIASITGRELYLESKEVLKGRVLTGSLFYQFNKTGESYPAGYTPVKLSLSSAPQKFFYATTDRMGLFYLSVDGTIDTLTTFNLNIVSPYYSQLPSGLKPAIGLDTIKLGNIITGVFNYTATFQVMEKYKDYYVDSLQNILVTNVEESVQKPVPGLDAVLYRKSKGNKIPQVEGQLDKTGKFTGSLPSGFDKGSLIPVATAKTTVEIKSNSEKITVVKFDHLICNMQNGDEYFIKVLTNDAILPNLETAEQNVAFVPKNNFMKGAYLQNQTGQSPAQQTYYQYKDTVYLISNEPPKSLIKGRLFYRWPDDANRRPLANMKFEVRVEYDFGVDGRAVSDMLYNKFTVTKDGNEIETFDNGKVVGTGVTGADGSFNLLVINHNKKGEVGDGTVDPLNIDPGYGNVTTPGTLSAEDKLKKELEKLKNPGKYLQELNEIRTNPTYENMLKDDSYTQQIINDNGLPGMDKATGVQINLNLDKKAIKTNTLQQESLKSSTKHGPSIDACDYESISGDDDKAIVGKVRRVLRIRIAGSPYYYSPEKDIVVQPYDNIDAGNMDAVVAEARFPIRVTDPAKNDLPLKGIKTLIFRQTPDNSGLPQGEGNQIGKKSKVISPTFEPSEVSGITQAFLNKEFEWLSYDETGSFGTVTLTRLLSNYQLSLTNYVLEVCSNPQDMTYFYKADFQEVKYRNYFVGYWNKGQFDKIKWDTLDVKLTALPSRIAGRTLDKVSANPIKGSAVTLDFNSNAQSGNNNSLWSNIASFLENTCYTDKYGYFEFLNKVTKDNSGFNILVSSSGYDPDSYPASIPKSGAQIYRDFFLYPDAHLKGQIVFDNFTPIKGAPSYIKVDSGKVFETYDSLGHFNINVPSGNNRKLFIIPKDVGYFNDTLNINIKKGTNTNPDIKAIVYRRQHRLLFKIADEQSHQFIKGAVITFSHDKTLKNTTSNNFPWDASFKFENVSVNAYSVKVEGPAGLDYIPKQVNLTNDESKYFVTYNIKLKPGKKIKGIVKLNGVPVKNALVYLDKSAMDKAVADSLPEMTARTDVNGNFTIHGIPLASEYTEVVRATLDTTFTVIGANALVESNNMTNVVLNLKKFSKSKVDTFYGIPFSLEDIKPLNSDTTKFTVTGKVHLDKCKSQFGWIDNSVSSVRVRDASMTLKKINNQFIATPDRDSVEIDATTSLKMRYAQKYNVSVTRNALTYNKSIANNIILKRGGDGNGYMNGFVKLVDNSFNFPSTYISFDKAKGEFCLGEISGNKIRNNIRVMTMQNTVVNILSVYKPFNISDSKGNPIGFSFLGFDATADPLNSTIDQGGEITLSVNVKCHLQNAQPDTFSLHLEGLKLDNNSVKPYSGTNTLKVFLEKWILEVNNWSIDVKEGGITSGYGIVRTGTVDVPFKHFVLRPDLFVFDNFSMDKLQIGGGLELTVNSGIQPILVYDTKIGADQSGHWKFVLVGTDQNPVSVITLPALNKPLRIKYITLLSNNTENMVGIFPDKFILHDVCYFNPDMFSAGKDYFVLAGGLDLNGPRLGPIAANINFNKPAGKGIQYVDTDPINYEFEGLGYVKFIAENVKPIISDKKFELAGVLREPDKFNDINSRLIVEGNPVQTPDKRFRVEAENGFLLKLSSNAFDLKLKNALSGKKFNGTSFNGMMVAGPDWDNLQFTGELIEKSAKPTLSNSGTPTVLTFTVYGDIQASSDNVQVSNLSPLPGLTLTYIFAEERLVGNLTLTKMDFGGYSVSGAMEFSIGKPGWYMAAAAQISGIPVINDFSAGFLLGMYSQKLPDNVIQIATQFSKTVPCALKDQKSSYNGLFITGQKSMPLIPSVDIGFNAGIVSFYVKVVMPTVDVSLFTSFDPFSIQMGLGVYAGVYAGMSSITCTDISGSAEVIGRVYGSFSKSNLSIGGDICGSIAVSVSQGIPTLVTGCELRSSIFDESIGLKIHASVSTANGKDFGFDLGKGCAVTCF